MSGDPIVAVLLCTHNGADFVQAQLQSLANNTTPFTLHWLDDHSNDGTRDVVLSSAHKHGLSLVEHHLPTHIGIPGGFFRLLELVEADIYLFCDQDDIWLPGKIDATVTTLACAMASPILCFSDTTLFGGKYSHPRNLSDIVGKRKAHESLCRASMLEMFSRAVAPGHTQGFTRPLRDLFLIHKSIAYENAFMHDWWMHDIAISVGTICLFSSSSTVLWRQHEESFCARLSVKGIFSIIARWHKIQYWRRVYARHARGLAILAPMLPATPKSTRLMELAKLIGVIDRRQSVFLVVKLFLERATPTSRLGALLFLLACLVSDADRGSELTHQTGHAAR